MFLITTPKDIWLIRIVVTRGITLFLALLIMALYPRSEWV